MKPHAACSVLLLTGWTAMPALPADAAVDTELLEFLGAFAEDDADFLDFLERRPPDRRAAEAGKTAPASPDPQKPSETATPERATEGRKP